MKGQKLFLKIYIPFVIVIIFALIVLQILGSKTRIGYLTDFKLIYKISNSDNMVSTNYLYHFKIGYYDKVFRNSDIYGVYPDLSNLPDYIKEVEMDTGGSPFGNFVSSKIIEEDRIDNVNYILKVKFQFIMIFFSVILFFLFVLKSEYIINLINKYFDKNKILYTKIIFYILYIIAILIFISFHEPWRDEGQAWLLARDLNWLDLFLQTGAEGHPFLWSFILKPFTSLSFETTLFTINVLIVFLAIYLLLFKSDFGSLFSLVILFTPMIAYEYPVVARHYGLTFLLFIGMTIAYKKRFEKPMIYVFIVFLFTNSTVMGSIIGILETFIFLYQISLRINKNKNVFKEYLPSISLSVISLLIISFQILLMFYIRILFYRDIRIFPNDNTFYIFSAFVILIEFIFVCFSFYYLSFKKSININSFAMLLIRVIFTLILSAIVNSVSKMGDRHSFIIILYISYCILSYCRNKFESNIKYFYYVYIFTIFILISICKIDISYSLIKADINNDFSGAKKAADYIKSNNLNDKNKYLLITYDEAPWIGAVAPYFKEKIFDMAYYQKYGSFTDWRYWGIRYRFIDTNFITNLNNKTIISVGLGPSIENIDYIYLTTFYGIRENITFYIVTNK